MTGSKETPKEPIWTFFCILKFEILAKYLLILIRCIVEVRTEFE